MCGRENNKTLPPFWKKLTQTDYKNIVTGDVQKHKPAAVCGSILADEVGLGKRLEVIALILTNRLHEGQASSRSKLATASNVTKAKISSFEDTANNKFENNQSREKMKQERKSRSFDMFRGFNRYALPSCHKLKIGPPKSNLIVCTFSLLSNWLKQIETHVTSNLGLSVFLYHKKDRFNYAMDYIMSHDIVISTYKVLAVDFKNTKIGEKSDGTGNQVKSNSLLDCKFLRVVLDEGYLIRNSKKATSQALFSIKAEKHWIISNTIIQNSLPDFWAFMRFLRLKPFENPDDGQRLWKKHVEKPLLKDFDKKIAKHFNSLLMTLVLRRTKTTEYLPKKTVKLMKIKLSTEEKKLYRSMESAGRGIVRYYFRIGCQLSHYAHIMAIITRLRQLVCHPSFCKKTISLAYEAVSSSAREEKTQAKLIETMNIILGSKWDEECCLCYGFYESLVITYCAHVFCKECIEKYFQIPEPRSEIVCPLCRSVVAKKT